MNFTYPLLMAKEYDEYPYCSDVEFVGIFGVLKMSPLAKFLFTGGVRSARHECAIQDDHVLGKAIDGDGSGSAGRRLLRPDRDADAEGALGHGRQLPIADPYLFTIGQWLRGRLHRSQTLPAVLRAQDAYGRTAQRDESDRRAAISIVCAVRSPD
jgi:hypothetical protein